MHTLRNCTRTLFAMSLLCCTSLLTAQDDFRIWTDKTGSFQKTAKFIEIKDGKAVLEKRDGIRLEVEVDKLSVADQELLKRWAPQAFDKTDMDKPKDDGAAAKNDGAAAKDDGAAAEDDGAAAGVCKRCHGLTIVPTSKLKTLTHVREDNNFEDLPDRLIAEYCPHCSPGKDASGLASWFHLPHDETLAQHKEWEEIVGEDLVRVETNYLTIHSQFPERETLQVAKALEKLERELQQELDSMILSNRRLGDDEHFIFADQYAWDRFVDFMDEADESDNDWEVTRQVAMSYWGNRTFNRAIGHSDVAQISSAAVYVSGFAQIAEAINYEQCEWLKAGFAAVCESMVMDRNTCFMAGTIYEDGKHVLRLRNVNVDQSNWDRVIKLHARQKKLVPWRDITQLSYGDYEQLHDLQCKSMVRFLMRDKEEFIQFIQLLESGENQFDALETVMGKGFEEIENDWKRWLR